MSRSCDINEKRQSILDAAISLIMDGRPPSELRMAEIAARAGIGKGTLYEYFDSKEELTEEALADHRRRVFGRLCEAVGAADGPEGKTDALLDFVYATAAGCAKSSVALSCTVNGGQTIEAIVASRRAKIDEGMEMLDRLCALLLGQQPDCRFSSSYLRMTLFGSIAAYLYALCACRTPAEADTARASSRSMLLSCLK